MAVPVEGLRLESGQASLDMFILHPRDSGSPKTSGWLDNTHGLKAATPSRNSTGSSLGA